MRVHAIEIEAFEAIVRGGVRRVTWLVENDGEWRMASEQPGASVEPLDAGPGMVWVRRVTLSLPPGARLLRVESAPKQAAPRDPLAYLFEPQQRNSRQTRRSQFVVGVSGKLVRVEPRRT
ncbi:MAG TPA: hypothetical protein VMG12_05860 [Polyangiaceae bacterium]|nr:hypothetical protein [Polyangiaceae bacterium]